MILKGMTQTIYASMGLRSKLRCPNLALMICSDILWNDLEKYLYDLIWIKYYLDTCDTSESATKNVSTIHCDIFVKTNYEMSIQKCLYIGFVWYSDVI